MSAVDLVELARKFHRRLSAARASERTAFNWYPYDSLANARHLTDLLGGDAAGRIRELAGDGAVLDIGCADGDFAFLLEGLGLPVHAVDSPVTNYNGMRGVYELRRRVGSRIQVAGLDLDDRFRLPGERYGLALCLGVLYHLKNPYYLLEKLARACNYLIISTRVTSSVPGVAEPVGQVGLAYFLNDDELNEDNSNYWILTPECLLRLVRRTQWAVEATRTYSLGGRSDPTSLENDERMFLLLRSRYGKAEAVEYVGGWHRPENEGWRWTERRFSIRVAVEGSRRKIVLKAYVPDAILHPAPLVLEGFADGTPLGSESYYLAGDQTYTRTLPEGAARIDFVVNRAIPPDAGDNRERALIVASCEVERF